ncbi:MAG: ATP-binding protein [Fodinibius sp.]|nr:ATP-binding protein [Fodinibius sp.]
MSGKYPEKSLSKKNMGSLIHSHAWSETPLGAIDQWPETFSSLVSTILEIKLPILICWGKQLITIYNDAYRPLLGESPDVLGQPFREISSEAYKIVARQINQVLTTGKPVLINNVKFPVLEGRTAWFDYSYSPIRDSKGNIMGIIKMAIDVTERVRAEDELTKLHKLINKRVKQRTIDLKDYKNQLQKLIYRLNKAQGIESHNIGRLLHDHLGQLLDLCVIKTDELRQKVGKDDLLLKIDGLKELLLKATNKTTEVVNMLKPPPIFEKENLVELLEWLAKQMGNYNLDVTVEDDGQPKSVNNENHLILYESVRELCFNVIKHAEVNEVTITLRRAGNQVHIIVQDNGKGFNIAEEQKKFDVDGGFGLFNINERIKRLGGSMNIESQPGKGTKVLLAAPLKTNTISNYEE